MHHMLKSDECLVIIRLKFISDITKIILMSVNGYILMSLYHDGIDSEDIGWIPPFNIYIAMYGNPESGPEV